jgi:hypothetical protein
VEPCPVGTYSNATGLVSEKDCISCRKGLSTKFSGSISINDCVCAAGTYSLFSGGLSSELECFPCVSGLQCGINGLVSGEIQVESGYFIVQSSDGLVTASECANKKACEPDGCKDGYDGFLCARCDDKYFNVNGGNAKSVSCVACGEGVLNFALQLTYLGIFFLCSFILYVVVVWKKLKKIENADSEEEGEDKMSEVQRIALSHLQGMRFLILIYIL